MADMNIAKRMRQVLTAKSLRTLETIGAVADGRGTNAFIVGGTVRDVLLGAKHVDIDIVVEADAIAFGAALAKETGGSLVSYRRFGTATLATPEEVRIDLVTARRERYARPGVLPTVEPGSLDDDLRRRDFTINALAASLNQRSFGRLIDRSGGHRDLARGMIRVLHDGSFIDDPTRIFRAVRFEERLGFAIEPHTEELMRHAIRAGMLERIESRRVRNEIILILAESKPFRVLGRIRGLHAALGLEPGQQFERALAKVLAERSADDPMVERGVVPRVTKITARAGVKGRA